MTDDPSRAIREAGRQVADQYYVPKINDDLDLLPAKKVGINTFTPKKEENSMKKRVLLIDAYNSFIRCYCANPSLGVDGQPIGGTVGFLNSLKNLIWKLRPTNVVVCWEAGGSRRRRQILPEYKQNRKPGRFNRFYEDMGDSENNRQQQIGYLVHILEYSGICQVLIENAEADDIIGYLVKSRYKNDEVVIVSSDKDFYQLLEGNRIRQWSLNRKQLIDEGHVLREYNIHPVNFATAKCVSGDTSDNIPGIKGAGFKTIAKRFPDLAGSEFVSIQDIFDQAKEKNQKKKLKLYERIIDNYELLKKNWKLMYLHTECLAYSQIKNIDNSLDSFAPIRQKLKIFKILHKEEIINKFDIERYFDAVKSVNQGEM